MCIGLKRVHNAADNSVFISTAENVCTLLCEISPQLNYVTVDILHSDPVYHSTQLYINTSHLSCALTTLKLIYKFYV